MPNYTPRLVVGLCLVLAASGARAAENWPDFRGPLQNGAAPSQSKPLPLRWSETEGVRWKTAIPGRGWSTPVIWGDQVWLTTADEEGRRLFAVCVDRQSGKLTRQVKVFDVAQPEPINPTNSYASPSPVIEEGRVYVHFGTYGTAAIDTSSGEILWKRDDFKLDHKEGPGSSPILFESLLIFHVDGMDVQYVVALDKSTGEIVWKTDRSADLASVRDDFRKAYSTPLVVTAGGKPQLISTGAHACYGYDPRTGKELWRIDYNGFSNVSRPVAAGSVAYINTGFTRPQLWAVELGERGLPSEQDILWKQSRGVPAKTSVVVADGLVYMVLDNGGVAACLDAATGEAVWTERLAGNFSASPLYGQGRVYFCDEQGKTTVVAAGREFRKLAVNELEDGMMASPAAADGRLFLRTKTHLYCIEESSETERPAPPVDLGAGNTQAIGINYASAAVTLPDGTLQSFARRSAGGRVSIFGVASRDEGRTWSDPEELVGLEVAPWGGPIPLLDQEGELHFVIPRVRGEGRRPAVDRFIDLYHLRSTDGRTRWTEPQRIFEGYCGAIQCLVQLKSGRIIAPFADWLPGVPTAPPTGPSVTTAVYSDDGGQTWRRSPAALTAPCYEGYNGANYGACEPTILELRDGRVWMLIRTQAGRLYESFSEDGVDWSPAAPSRFASSNSPAFPIRLRDGRIVVFWNNCEMPPRAGNAGVYGGRDALHAAISDDEGRSWRGFREVYRDPTRHESPPRSGDRGTAYPHATLTQSGKILLVSGQGENRRRRFLIDPDWLLETGASDDLASLDAWHAFKGFGPAARFWRDRTASAAHVAHPDRPQAKALHLRRADESEPDGATWNFPAGKRGRLKLRLRIAEGFGGASVALADRMFEPCDDNGEEKSIFRLTIAPDGAVGADARIEPGRWQTIELAWNADRCEARLDGALAATLAAQSTAPNGLSYLRLRSLADAVDPHGFWVDFIEAEIEE